MVDPFHVRAQYKRNDARTNFFGGGPNWDLFFVFFLFWVVDYCTWSLSYIRLWSIIVRGGSVFSIVHVIHLKRGGNDEVCELDPLVHVHFGLFGR